MGNDRDDPNAWAREAWNANAAFWDERMGEGNSFFRLLEWPATERLLQLQPGERVLDVACGNGLTSRLMAAAGAQVLAIDLAEEMIARARARTLEHGERIEYRVLDATDEAALLGLGEGRFDAALCNMALFDMAEIDPLMRALARLLRPGGRFVFSVLHPCFNHTRAAHVAEEEDHGGQVVTTYSVKVSGYLTPAVNAGVAMIGQPVPQPYFDRPLQVLLGACFAAGLVLDGLEERSFPPEDVGGNTPLSWNGRYSEIPPVLVARARRG
ncbi:MAG TPA: methyltransferase domain-containing protein [Anaerolineae bacterium]|nr:methyltransferase domain-containing protein [Anaerolineae bacterium]HPL29023.1 methyltransferase domain-containing protein [Anaerolineae bacterium]